MGVLALHRQLLHPLQSAGAHKRLAPANRGSAPGSPVPRAHVALALRPRPGCRSAVSCFALLAPTQHLTIPVGISILHLCPSWGNGHGTELELTPSLANPRSRDPGVCQATHVACPPCPGTRECARAAEQASHPGAWAQAQTAGRPCPRVSRRLRCVPHRQALTSSLGAGAVQLPLSTWCS